MRATSPPTRKATGVPPCARLTAKPRSAKIPPPIMPPRPIEVTDRKPKDFLFFSAAGIMVVFLSLLRIGISFDTSHDHPLCDQLLISNGEKDHHVNLPCFRKHTS